MLLSVLSYKMQLHQLKIALCHPYMFITLTSVWFGWLKSAYNLITLFKVKLEIENT